MSLSSPITHVSALKGSSGAGMLSGLQRNVLSLYRSLLRISYQKDLCAAKASNSSTSDRVEHDSVSRCLSSSSSSQSRITFLSCLQNNIVENSTSTTSVHYTRQEFRRRAASVKKTDFKTIEHMVRKGEKHIKLLKMPGVKVISGSSIS
jgi:hypothetical protein